MKYVAQFEKVSYDQFRKDMIKNTDIDTKFIPYHYDEVKLPKRGSKGSAGYDFVIPYAVIIQPGESKIIPTGIRCKIDDSWVLSLYPRSGLGFKTHVRLANSVGIIDRDYYYTDNEGHIMVKLVAADKPIELNCGDRFCQGVFTEYGITVDDECEAERTGGFGSTGA